MFCNKCGNQINPGDNVCSKCGNPVGNAGNFQAQQQQVNFNQQPNYQQPRQNFAQAPRSIDFHSIKGNSVWQVNIGWLLVIAALFGIFSTFCMGMVSSVGTTVSFIQLESGDDLPGGFVAFSVFIWIFSIISILGVLITALYLFANKISNAFKFSLINLALITVTKILQMISVATLGNEYYKPDLAYMLFLSLVIVIIAGIINFIFAKSHNMNLSFNFNNGMHPNQYQYQNVPNPNQYQNVNQGNNNQNPNQNNQ